MTKWRFEVRAPDGRVWRFDTEHEANAFAFRFNLHIPRGGKLATVHVLPRSL